MRKIIVYVATSADGYIARPDGDVSWLDRPRLPGDYGMPAFYRSVDTVLMGRRTYDFAVAHGQGAYPGKKNYVFSRTLRGVQPADVEIVNEDIRTFSARLRDRKGRNVWMVGGADLIAAFVDAGEIDEYIIHVIPIIIGEGIPLLSPRRRAIQLKLLSTKSYSDGVVRLHYSVAPDAAVASIPFEAEDAMRSAG